MLNLVVADDNMHYSKLLINYLTISIPDIKLVNICTNGKEVINVLSKNNIDILILDLKMPILDGIQTLHSIENLGLKKIPYIFAISGEIDFFRQIYNNPMVIECLNKASDFQTILQRLNCKIVEIKKEKNYGTIKQLIIDKLKSLGFNLKHIGTTYILEAILIIYNSSDDSLIENLEKNVYRIIAQKYSKTVHNIKSNICKASNIMYAECNQKYLKSFFNFYDDIKPTPKMIIKTILMIIS